MTRRLQLSNAANWEQIYNNSFTAGILGNGSAYVPIPEVEIPVILESHVVAIHIDTAVPEGRSWNFAGFLFQRYQLGLVLGGIPDADTITTRKLSLGRIQLVVFPKIAPTYSLAVKFPKWFKSASITVWQYTGPDTESSEDLMNQLIADVARVEQKIDDLSV
jgi:hypothetical protein